MWLVQDLPVSIESEEDRQTYEQFLRDFGTHYFRVAVLGAQVDFCLGAIHLGRRIPP